MIEQDLLREMLLKKSYDKRKVTLASGKESDFYIDCKKTLLTAVGHRLAGMVLLRTINDRFLQQNHPIGAVAGVELGGCPLASAVSLMSVTEMPGTCWPALYVRKQAKDHGTKTLVEAGDLDGSSKDGLRVVLLEDVITTGGSTKRAIATLREWGANVVGVVCLVDREEEGRPIDVIDGVPVHHVFTRTTLLSGR